jgi:hypothetical protein
MSLSYEKIPILFPKSQSCILNGITPICRESNNSQTAQGHQFKGRGGSSTGHRWKYVHPINIFAENEVSAYI